MTRVEIRALGDIPLVQAHADLPSLIADALAREETTLQDYDILVIAQKIVSKSEDRLLELGNIVPSPKAIELAETIGKDARFVEAVLSESTRVVRTRCDLIIVEHRLGFVCANAGIDQSNVAADAGAILLLPIDPDASAERLRAALQARYSARIAVLISDSIGRAWRRGTIGTAIGAAGLPSLLDLRGKPDLFGRPLRTTTVGFADEVAAAASLLMGQGAEGMPVVLVRGLAWPDESLPARALVRPETEDLFR